MKLRLLLPLLLIVLAACNFGGVEVERNPEGGLDITATLTEAEVNAAITEALAQNPNPLLRDPDVDLQNGRIIINGQHTRRDGSGTVTGTMTMTLGVANGLLTAQITQVEIDGWDANDARIAEFNQRLADGLSRIAQGSRASITFTEVTITDAELRIAFTARQQ